VRLEQPLWLLLALPVLAALALSLRETLGRKAAIVFPGLRDMSEAVPLPAAALVRWTPTVLKAAVLLLAVAALARPQAVRRQVSGLAEGIDILLLMDTSLSMRRPDFAPLDRMSAAKMAAKDFVGKRISDRIGIVVFGGVPLLSCPLTLDYDALLEFLDGIQAGMTYSDYTAIGDGIAAGVNHLKDSTGKSKVLILLTDGRSNTGLVDPLTAAKTAATFKIKIYTIGTGRRGVEEELDEDMLLKVAAETNGRYFRATNIAELAAIYGEIDKLEKTAYARPEIVTYEDLYALILLPAALLLGAAILLGETLLARLP